MNLITCKQLELEKKSLSSHILTSDGLAL